MHKYMYILYRAMCSISSSYMYCLSSPPIMQEDEMADFRDFLTEEMVKDRVVPR